MRDTHGKVPILLLFCVLEEFSENQQITAALEVKKSHMRNLDDDFVKTGIFLWNSFWWPIQYIEITELVLENFW